MTGDHHTTGAARTAVAAVRSLLAAEPRHTAIAFVLALVGAAVEGLGLLLLVPILGVATGSGELAWVRDAAERWGPASPRALMAGLVGAFVVLMILRGLALYARDMAVQSLQMRFVNAQRLRVMRALAVAPWSRVAALDHARITTLIGLDMSRIGTAVQLMMQIVIALIMIAVQLAVIAALSMALAMVAAVGLAAGGGVLLLAQARAYARGGESLAVSRKMMANASGFLGGLKIAAAQHMRERFVAEFDAAQEVVQATGMAFQRGQALARLGFSVGAALALAAVVLGGAGLLGIAPARLIVVVLVFARMVGPVQQLQQAVVGIAYGLPAFASVERAEREFAGAAADPAGEAPTGGVIRLDGVAYRHPDGRGLSHATLELPAGAIVGLTGPSGGGKTTLIDVIAGLLPPQNGTATAGGRSIAGGWGEGVAYVPQDGFLFHDTVRRNLDWGDRTIDEATLQSALAQAGASEVVARMARGLDTVVGERGALLSGGERQRLAIARALLRRPTLLILDEATNAIDEAGEAALLDRLAALDPRPTILIVAHRDSSLRRCDHLIRVEEGVARLV